MNFTTEATCHKVWNLTFIQFGAEEMSPPWIRIQCGQWSRSQDWAANAAISSLLAYVKSWNGDAAEWTQIVVNLHLHTSCHTTPVWQQTWRPCVPSCDVTARRRRDCANRLVGQTLIIDGSGVYYAPKFCCLIEYKMLWYFYLDIGVKSKAKPGKNILCKIFRLAYLSLWMQFLCCFASIN